MKNEKGRPEGTCKIPESLIGYWLTVARNPKDKQEFEKRGNKRQKTYLKEAIKMIIKNEKTENSDNKYNKKGSVRRKK